MPYIYKYFILKKKLHYMDKTFIIQLNLSADNRILLVYHLLYDHIINILKYPLYLPNNLTNLKYRTPSTSPHSHTFHIYHHEIPRPPKRPTRLQLVLGQTLCQTCIDIQRPFSNHKQPNLLDIPNSNPTQTTPPSHT